MGSLDCWLRNHTDRQSCTWLGCIEEHCQWPQGRTKRQREDQWNTWLKWMFSKMKRYFEREKLSEKAMQSKSTQLSYTHVIDDSQLHIFTRWYIGKLQFVRLLTIAADNEGNQCVVFRNEASNELDIFFSNNGLSSCEAKSNILTILLPPNKEEQPCSTELSLDRTEATLDDQCRMDSITLAFIWLNLDHSIRRWWWSMQKHQLSSTTHLKRVSKKWSHSMLRD